MDKRINNGGKREGSGRKPKADEERIRDLSLNALESIYGSEEKAFEHIAKLAKDSFPHLKLLFEYAYGKPKESRHINAHIEQPLFPEPKKIEVEIIRQIIPQTK